MQDILVDVISSICAITLVACLLVYLFYILIYCIKTEKMRQDHIKTLNEHDKSVVLDYKNTFWTLRKRNKKCQKKSGQQE